MWLFVQSKTNKWTLARHTCVATFQTLYLTFKLQGTSEIVSVFKASLARKTCSLTFPFAKFGQKLFSPRDSRLIWEKTQVSARE